MMSLKEFYDHIGGDYVDVMERLKKEDRILRILYILPQDESLSLLQTALNTNDYKTAFRAVHSIKGIYMNLGFSSALPAVSEMTEALRSGEPTIDIAPLYQKIQSDYNRIMKMVREYI